MTSRGFPFVLSVLLLASPAIARVEPFPASFKIHEIATNGTTLHVRVGGAGPAVLLLHGFGDTGDMWAPLAAKLMKDHTIVVPDLRGMGLSAHPETGYEKKNQAVDIVGVLDDLKIGTCDLVTHDIGNMVGYALAARVMEENPADTMALVMEFLAKRVAEADRSQNLSGRLCVSGSPTPRSSRLGSQTRTQPRSGCRQEAGNGMCLKSRSSPMEPLPIRQVFGFPSC